MKRLMCHGPALGGFFRAAASASFTAKRANATQVITEPLTVSEAAAATPAPAAQRPVIAFIVEHLVRASAAPPPAVGVADSATAAATQKTDNTQQQHHQEEEATLFVNRFASLLRHETRVSQRRRRYVGRTRREVKEEPALLTATQQQRVLHRLTEIVQQRQVSLLVATRLVKRHWPPALDNHNSRDVQQFIKQSLKAWIVDGIKEKVISPSEARAILANAAYLLRNEDVAVVGNLAQIATQDVAEVSRPDALISLIWSIHTSGAHAPARFWHTLVDRLLFLNDDLRGKMIGVMDENNVKAQTENESASTTAADAKRDARREVGHVFSGLTTRQIYRLLEVLKRERWNGDAGALRELADQALKNIVFEAEAAAFMTAAGDITGPGRLTKRDVEDRIKAVADLDTEEFVQLLSISGDFGIPFSISAARVSDHILTPMAQYLDSTQLLLVMQIARQTRCNSVSLMSTLAGKIEHRGVAAPYALPLSKTLTRTILREPDLFPHVNLTPFFLFFLQVCEEQATKVRGAEVCSLADVLYGLSRRFSPTSTIGLQIRSCMDTLCRQMNRLLQLNVASAAYGSRLLETTIVMGMRQQPETYPSVGELLATRNVAVEKERARMDKASERANAQSLQEERLSQRWEDQQEASLPRISKAALTVYSELMYMFERMAVVKASLGAPDFNRFRKAVEKSGLHSIFVGADLMNLAHLQDLPKPVAGKEAAAAAGTLRAPLSTLPGWMEKQVSTVVVRKVRTAALSQASSNDDVLHVLGHVHCNEAKVSHFIDLVLTSPLRILRNQRDLWVYIVELARRFGSEADQQRAAKCLTSALY